MVITEDDYLTFLANMDGILRREVLLRKHLATKVQLFVGYSIRDWNIRVFLNQLTGSTRVSREPGCGCAPVGGVPAS